MDKIESVINANYPALFITKFFNLAEVFTLLSETEIMAPEYIFIEDLYFENTFITLRKICRLEKDSETKIVIFGSTTEKIDTKRLRSCQVKMLTIPDYDNINLTEISASLKETFARID